MPYYDCVCVCVFVSPQSCGITGIRLSSEQTFVESISDASPQSLTFRVCPLSKRPKQTQTHAHFQAHTHTQIPYTPMINLPPVTTTAKHKANHINTTGMPRSPSDEMSLERLCQETSALLRVWCVCVCVFKIEREREQKN